LSPTSNLSMKERIDILKRFPGGSPISLQFTPVGPIPGLPGLVPPVVDTRLRGFSSPAQSDLNYKEGLTQSDPRFSSGLPAFPGLGPDEQRLGQLPPSTAMPPPSQVLQFHPETGDLLKLSDGSPLMGPDPYKLSHDPADDPAVLRGMAIFAAAMAVPALLPLAPVLAPIAAFGLLGATAARAEPIRNPSSGAPATGASPYTPSDPNSDMSSTGYENLPLGSRPSPVQVPNNPFDQGRMQAGTFADRFGSWADAPAGKPVQDAQEMSAPSAAEAAGREDVRRLTRINASNAVSVFTSGSTPVPYLPSTEFNDRFGNWTTPTASGLPSQASKPIGPLADEPSYIIPPPIFGVDGSGHPHNDGEEWFSRWIRPFLPRE
jgi:hypothetical protein